MSEQRRGADFGGAPEGPAARGCAPGDSCRDGLWRSRTRASSARGWGGFPPAPAGTALLLALAAGACGGSGPLRPEEALDRCPAPGVGVSVGGIGGEEDTEGVPFRRVVLMGGGPEDDEAATLFAEGAGGGDILVLQATGSLTRDPDYFLSQLTPFPAPASVVAIRTNTLEDGDDPAVLCYLERAEAVWIAGGDPWDYLGGWPSGLHSALADLAGSGKAVGGTSAGAVVLGEAAFDARQGSVTSSEALADPLRAEVTLTYPTFAQPELTGYLVEVHFDQGDREGRLLAFLARFLVDRGRPVVWGVALEEGAALVVQEGYFRVFGPPAAGAWIYRVTGPATLQAGAPLDLEGVHRVRLVPGAQGSWPFVLGPGVGEPLRVRNGVVETG